MKDLTYRGVVGYIKDILIYSKIEEELVDLTKQVLRKLADNCLCINAKKYVSHSPEVEFMGYTIGSNGVSMSDNKVKDILVWNVARCVHEAHSS